MKLYKFHNGNGVVAIDISAICSIQAEGEKDIRYIFRGSSMINSMGCRSREHRDAELQRIINMMEDES